VGSISVVTESTVDPVTLVEAKAHLNCDHSDDDAGITSMITAAAKWCEAYCNRRFVRATLRQDQNGFGDTIVLSSGPVLAVDSIVYDDVDGAEQTVSTSPEQYELDVYNAVVRPTYGATWPAARNHWNSVRITYQLGYFTSSSPEDERGNVPQTVKNSILMIVGDLYENREGQQAVELYSNPAVKMMLQPYRLYQ